MESRYEFMLKEIEESKALVLLEVGVYRAERSGQMIERALKSALEQNVHFYGVDLFEDMTPELKTLEVSRSQGPMSKEEASEYLESSYPGVNILLFKGDSKETLPMLNGLIRTPDVVFIDGGHSFPTAFSDWKNVEAMMGDWTTVFFDDYSEISTMINTKKVVDTIDRDKYTVTISPECDHASSDYESADLRIAKVVRK